MRHNFRNCEQISKNILPVCKSDTQRVIIEPIVRLFIKPMSAHYFRDAASGPFRDAVFGPFDLVFPGIPQSVNYIASGGDKRCLSQ